MSLVGPRPDLVEQAANYTDRDRGRLAVEPGITGWSQVNGREEITWPERIEQDLWYIEHWSLGLDAKILIRTFTQLGREEERPVEDEMNIERARSARRAESTEASPHAEVAPDTWNEVLEELGFVDVYLTREYVEASTLLEPGTPGSSSAPTRPFSPRSCATARPT